MLKFNQYLQAKYYVQKTTSLFPRLYSPGRNILVIYSVLVQVSFTKSKTELKMCYSKLCLRAVSQVTQKHKTWEILGVSQNRSRQSLVPNTPFSNNFLVIEIRN